jgi:PilZ domain
MEYRRWDRIPVEIQAQLFIGAETLGREARVVDLFWNGARIRAQGISLKRRKPVDVVLVGSHLTQRRSARVVWLEKVGLCAIEAGLHFLRPLGAEA